jgi:hypothetical protein
MAAIGTFTNDLHTYLPESMTWLNLARYASGDPPSPRENHGFASAGGKLYVYGGENYNGNGCMDIWCGG